MTRFGSMMALLMVLVAFGTPAAEAASGCQARPLRPGDQLWVINTRGIACRSDVPLQAARLTHYNCEHGWSAGKWDDLYAAMRERPTCVFVHGFNYGAEDAILAGQEIYSLLIAGGHEEPLNLVIWSWPSKRTGPILRDSRSKWYRSDLDARLMGAFLKRVGASQSVGLVGYSLGARVVMGGLHYLAAAAPAGESRVDKDFPSTARPNVLLLAAAVDSCSLSAGGQYGLAIGRVGTLTNLLNPRDPVLKRLRLISSNRAAVALGAAGAPSVVRRTGVLDQPNIAAAVGPHHRLRYYLRSAVTRQRLRSLLQSRVEAVAEVADHREPSAVKDNGAPTSPARIPAAADAS